MLEGVIGSYNGDFKSIHRTLKSVLSNYGVACSESFSFHPTILIMIIMESVTPDRNWQQYLVFLDSLSPWHGINKANNTDVAITNIVVSDNTLTYYASHSFGDRRDLIIDILAIGY